MQCIEQTIYQELLQHQPQDVYIAYSGGIDSQVLLHALHHVNIVQQWSMSITVCHVHHGLSANADNWQTFAKKQSDMYQAKFLTANVDISLDKNKNLEAKARDARYQALTQMTPRNALLLTGHHLDDQAETFLLALKRGSGLTGLSAMEKQRDLNGRSLFRPLLSVSRQAIEAYAKDNKLVWIEDESNADEDFDRNFLRQSIFPLLKSRWPAIQQTISRSAKHCADANAVLDEIAEQDKINSLLAPNVFDCQALLTLSSARFNQLIRFVLREQHCLMPSLVQLKELRQQLSVEHDKSPEVKVGDMWFRRYKNSLHLTAELADVSDWHYALNSNDFQTKTNIEISLPDNLGVLQFIEYSQVKTTFEHASEQDVSAYQLICLPKNCSIALTFKHNNDLCLPDYRDKSRSVKKVLQELLIPPWLRKRQLFIYHQNTLVAALGTFVVKAYQYKPMMEVPTDSLIVAMKISDNSVS